jgi:hypothetical protein
MSYITGTHAIAAKLGHIYTSAVVPLGTVVQGIDPEGAFAEFVFLKGVASTVVGSAVIYDKAGVTALTDSDAVGTKTGYVAVALTVCDASTKFAFYAITGTFPTSLAASVAIDAALYTSAAGGVLDDAKVADMQIVGAMSREATTGAAVVKCQLNRPFAGILMS